MQAGAAHDRRAALPGMGAPLTKEVGLVGQLQRDACARAVVKGLSLSVRSDASAGPVWGQMEEFAGDTAANQTAGQRQH